MGKYKPRYLKKTQDKRKIKNTTPSITYERRKIEKYGGSVIRQANFNNSEDVVKDLSLAVIEDKSLDECIVDLEEWYSDNCNSDDEEGYKLQLIISSLKNIADKDKNI